MTIYRTVSNKQIKGNFNPYDVNQNEWSYFYPEVIFGREGGRGEGPVQIPFEG